MDREVASWVQASSLLQMNLYLIWICIPLNPSFWLAMTPIMSVVAPFISLQFTFVQFVGCKGDYRNELCTSSCRRLILIFLIIVILGFLCSRFGGANQTNLSLLWNYLVLNGGGKQTETKYKQKNLDCKGTLDIDHRIGSHFFTTALACDFFLNERFTAHWTLWKTLPQRVWLEMLKGCRTRFNANEWWRNLFSCLGNWGYAGIPRASVR